MLDLLSSCLASIFLHKAITNPSLKWKRYISYASHQSNSPISSRYDLPLIKINWKDIGTRSKKKYGTNLICWKDWGRPMSLSQVASYQFYRALMTIDPMHTHSLNWITQHQLSLTIGKSISQLEAQYESMLNSRVKRKPIPHSYIYKIELLIVYWNESSYNIQFIMQHYF